MDKRNATIIRRWAAVRLILGFLQMFGAVFSFALFTKSGITPLAISAALITGIFTGISQLLFQVWKRGKHPSTQSARGDSTI